VDCRRFSHHYRTIPELKHGGLLYARSIHEKLTYKLILEILYDDFFHGED